MCQDKSIQPLTIRELLEQDNYIIPIYQRNYAWGDGEITALLMDMVKAYERGVENYYIGSLVVYRRSDGKFEVIDGQQRLTTFTLIKHFLQNEANREDSLSKLSNKRNISFEYRAESDHALDNLQQSESLPWNFKDAMQSIKRHWHALVGDKESAEIIKFILEQVQIIRTEVPPETDLNHYFEIMNTRGEQLEKHEILKARLMSRLQDLSRDANDQDSMPLILAAFANIWDACSDMSRYMVMGFKLEIREKIFGENWQQMPSENLDDIAAYFQMSKSESGQSDKHTMSEILAQGTTNRSGNQQDESQKSERFNPVIDFPNFLLHVLRVYQESIKVNLEQAREIQLDEKNLLNDFDVEKFELKDIKQFAILLLQCRYLLDAYVIKSDTAKEQENHWALLKIQPQVNNPKNYQYNNSFGDTDEQKKIVMLLAMFHVSHPARIYKNWLYAVLRWLYHNKNAISAPEYINFLEGLSDRYYFCHYGKGMDFFDLITDKSPDMQTVPDEKILNAGTNVPNFIFNRLDYLLWKNKLGKYDTFRFTFRSSVEHFYPQTPTNGEPPLKDNVLHKFGNLCLISPSMNSTFSNRAPRDKAQLGKEQNLSLKLSLMMAQAENWNAKTIDQHGEEMLKFLNKKSE